MSKAQQTTVEKKKAAIYCRVSTYDQSTGEYSSLSGQEDLLKRYCETQGWEIFDIYKDSVSGSNLEREQLQRIMLDAEDKKFQVLLATKLDRISRSVYDFLNLDNKLRELGIDIVIATQNIDTTTPTGKMQRTILLAFAEFERDMIAERTREKLFLQAQKGYWGGGHTPLGYNAVDKKLIVNREESELVNRIFNYYLETPSTNKVATRLNKEGFRPKQRKYLSGKSSGGGKFSKETIKRMLKNVIYIGNIKIKDQEFKGLHEPIIEVELFNKVQKKLSESASDKYATYQPKTQLSLLGILKCGYCGHSLTAISAKKGKNKYYKCTKIIKGSKEDCIAKALNADDLEYFLRRFIFQLAVDHEFLDVLYKRISKTSSSQVIDKINDKRELSKNLSMIKKDKTNLTNQIMNVPDLKEVSTVAKKLKELELKELVLEEQTSKLDREISQLKIQKINKSSLQDIFKDFNTIYDKLSIDSRRLINKLLFVEIVSYNSKQKDSGELEFKIRADGKLKSNWPKIVNPEMLSSQLRGHWLRR